MASHVGLVFTSKAAYRKYSYAQVLDILVARHWAAAFDPRTGLGITIEIAFDSVSSASKGGGLRIVTLDFSFAFAILECSTSSNTWARGKCSSVLISTHDQERSPFNYYRNTYAGRQAPSTTAPETVAMRSISSIWLVPSATPSTQLLGFRKRVALTKGVLITVIGIGYRAGGRSLPDIVG